LPDRFELKNGELILRAEGNSFVNSSPVLVNSADRKYEVQVEYTIDVGATAGLCLFYNEQGNLRISVDAEKFTVFNQQNAKIRATNEFGNHGFLRILNDENEISFYYSNDGKAWNRLERTIDATGFNHNVFGGFMSLRAGLFAFGTGKVKFDNFIYKKL
jgi:beta-xylosidase